MIETSVGNIGVEKHFHSTQGMFPDAEGMLSRREAEFARELERWRPGPLDRAGSGIAEEMVAQLRLRSREFRELGRAIFSAFVKDGGDVLAAAVERTRPPTLLRDHLAERLMAAASETPPATLEDWKRTVDTTVKPLLCAHMNHWAIEGGCGMAQAAVASGFPAEMLAAVHTHLIVMQIVNFRRHQAFGPCRWSVAAVEGEELVLGDVGPLCVYGRERRLSSWRASNLPLQSVFLPIGPRRLLVGSYRQRTHVPSSMRLNNSTFALSREFVVGRHPKSWFDRRTNFGARANELTPERTLGVEVPPASQVVDPMLAAVEGWVTALVGRHWASRQATGTPGGGDVGTDVAHSKPHVLVRPAALITSATGRDAAEHAHDVDGQ